MTEPTPTTHGFAVRIENLHKEYRLGGEIVRALRGVNLEVPQGDYVAIMGPSGSGKSTLLNVLGCLDQPSSGHYFLAGEDVAQLEDDRLSLIRASHIGFVFQSYNLIQQLTVLENIESPLYYQGNITGADRDRCRALAAEVGLGDRLGHRPMQLSGGQQQRAAIARSLANHPQFILADEPTGNLDTVTSHEILNILDRLNDEGRTIIMVTHEEDIARRARRIVRLRDGTIQTDERVRPPVTVSGPGKEGTRLADHAPAEAASGLAEKGGLAAWLQARLRVWQMGIKSLALHPLRSLLTILGIFIGVASVIWLLAIGEGISYKAQQQIAELGANNILLISSPPSAGQTTRRVSYAPYGITLDDFRHMEATIPTIEKCVPIKELYRRELRYGEHSVSGRVVGVSPAYLDLNRMEVDKGHFITDTEVKQNLKVCVLAVGIAHELFMHQNPLGCSIHIEGDYYRVVGVMKERAVASAIPGVVRGQDFSRDVYIPISTLWARIGDFYSRTSDGVPIASQVTVKVREQDKVMETAEMIRRMLSKTHEQEDYRITVPLELLEQARNTRLMFIAMMGLIAAISLVVGGIGIMNIMLATVTERTREIGIRRALGARRHDITVQFLVETLSLATVGGITGILGGLLCSPAMSGLRFLLEQLFPRMMKAMPDSIQNVVPLIVPWSIPLAFFIAMTVGVVFGMYPAQRAAAMNPIEALRHE
ncbi:MAG: ABC transporter permease [Verrucomicrobiota bacterium]